MRNNSKKAVVRTISTFLKSELGGDNKLVLVTPCGIVTGKPVAADSTIDKAAGDPEYFAEETGLTLLSAIYAKASSAEGAMLSDDALLLSEVTIYPSTDKAFELGQLIVFYDQIEAVTFGNVAIPE